MQTIKLEVAHFTHTHTHSHLMSIHQTHSHTHKTLRCAAGTLECQRATSKKENITRICFISIALSTHVSLSREDIDARWCGVTYLCVACTSILLMKIVFYGAAKYSCVMTSTSKLCGLLIYCTAYCKTVFKGGIAFIEFTYFHLGFENQTYGL